MAESNAPREMAKHRLISQISLMLGYVPIGLGDTLSMLTHPDALPLLENYIDAVKKESDTVSTKVDPKKCMHEHFTAQCTDCGAANLQGLR